MVAVCAGEKDVSEDALLAVAGAAEKRSEHPLGRAIVAAATEHAGAAPKDPTSFAMVPGRGVVAEVGGRTVYAGSAALLAEHGLAIPDALGRRVDATRAEGATITYLGWGDTAAGFIALVNDDIAELPHLLRLSRRMMTTIKINLTFSMTLNFIAIALAISGVLNPVVGALVHNAGSVLVIVNSALLLGWKPRVR